MIYQDDYDVDFEIPRSVRRQIERDYIQRTYYWALALTSFIIGFLLGVVV